MSFEFEGLRALLWTCAYCFVFHPIGKAERHTLHISPGVIKVRPGQDVSVLCYSMQMDRRSRGPRPKLRAFDQRLGLYVTDTDDNAVSGSITRIDPSFNGTIVECYSDVSAFQLFFTMLLSNGVLKGRISFRPPMLTQSVLSSTLKTSAHRATVAAAMVNALKPVDSVMVVVTVLMDLMKIRLSVVRF